MSKTKDIIFITQIVVLGLAIPLNATVFTNEPTKNYRYNETRMVSGITTPFKDAVLKSTVSGTISKINIKEGIKLLAEWVSKNKELFERK